MINLNRTTAEITAEIQEAARAAGIETRAEERWEGDGVIEIWPGGREGQAGTPGLIVAGTDTGLTPAIDADRGDGEIAEQGLIRTAADAVAWLAGRREPAGRA